MALTEVGQGSFHGDGRGIAHLVNISAGPSCMTYIYDQLLADLNALPSVYPLIRV